MKDYIINALHVFQYAFNEDLYWKRRAKVQIWGGYFPGFVFS